MRGYYPIQNHPLTFDPCFRFVAEHIEERYLIILWILLVYHIYYRTLLTCIYRQSNMPQVISRRTLLGSLIHERRTISRRIKSLVASNIIPSLIIFLLKLMSYTLYKQGKNVHKFVHQFYICLLISKSFLSGIRCILPKLSLLEVK